MDFTEIYKQSSSLVAFSAGAHFILNAISDRLIVRRADSFQITRTWILDASPSNSTQQTLATGTKVKTTSLPSATNPPESPISHIGWSCDSEYVLGACIKRGFVNVFKLRDEFWNARIDAGAEGLAKAEWAPDGRTILCFSEWGLRVTVWFLATGTATYIQYPVHPDRGYAFRSDGRYFVLAERHKSKDTVGVYDVSESYKLARHFPLPTGSLANLSLSPTGNHLAVWEGPLEYKLHILTLPGDHLASFSPDPDPGLGVRTVAWHPGGSFLAVGGWDEKIHILDRFTWSPVTTFHLTSRISDDVHIWREPSNWIESTEGRGFLTYEKLTGSQVISVAKTDHSRPNSKSGAVQLEWNKTGSLLLVRFENSRNVVHIFGFPSPSEPFTPKLRSVLIHSQSVLHARWNPVRKASLAICCGSRSLYTWSDEWVEGDQEVAQETAECIGIPAKKFDVRDLKWSPDGKGLILFDKDTFCCSFEVEDDEAT